MNNDKHDVKSPPSSPWPGLLGGLFGRPRLTREKSFSTQYEIEFSVQKQLFILFEEKKILNLLVEFT